MPGDFMPADNLRRGGFSQGLRASSLLYVKDDKCILFAQGYLAPHVNLILRPIILKDVDTHTTSGFNVAAGGEVLMLVPLYATWW